ncbi:restriction endonuclease subunit S [Corallincola luteus]|uniref:Restriction endonuclease subunit S n=1 Tax=Corallincola luteus TaxID=1775177 RepID=A0ABY2AHV6_9GAMM|nr:restriction endonuclease subunit S [Corallincola luteus]TCI02206.1 restriction endonuclease subunit S [Corallincola luteus]
MSSNWPLKKISDVAYFRNNKRIPLKSLDRAKRQGEFPYYGASGVVDYIDDYIFDGSYLLISEDGENLRTRKTPIAFQAHGKFWVNNHAHILEEKEEGILDYLEYYFSTLDLTPYITGAVQPKLNKANLDTIEIPIPPIDERRSLNRTLNHLRDKIAVNTQTNQTLEQIAQALFKSWFVDFDPVKAKMETLAAGGSADDAELAAMRVISAKTIDELNSLKASNPEAFNKLAQTAALFPAAMQDSELGEIPEGWEVVKTEQLAEKIAMGPFGSNIKVSTFVDNGVPIISGHHLKETLLTEGNHNFISTGHANKLKNSCVHSEDIVFTHAGNIGQVSLIPENTTYDEYVISQRQFYLRVDRERASPYYLVFFFKSNYGQHVLLSNASQVGVPSIARPSSHLKNIELIKPTLELMENFENICKSLLNGVGAGRKESLELAELRDTLLPKLLSGEINLMSEVVA